MEGLEYSSLVLHCSAIKNTVVYLHTFYSNGVKILSHSLSLTDSYKVVMAVLEKYEREGSYYLALIVLRRMSEKAVVIWHSMSSATT